MGLRRELQEELGIWARAGDVIDVTFHLYAEARKAVTLLFFEATRDPGSPPPRALEVAALRWASSAELDPSHFPPADAEVLRKVKKRLS
jgi:8-oxo-dGTP diphosphatase